MDPCEQFDGSEAMSTLRIHGLKYSQSDQTRGVLEGMISMYTVHIRTPMKFTLRKFNSEFSPEKLPGPHRKVVFQPPFSSGHVKLGGGGNMVHLKINP